MLEGDGTGVNSATCSDGLQNCAPETHVAANDVTVH